MSRCFFARRKNCLENAFLRYPLSSCGEMVLVEVPSPIAAAFRLAEGQGEPDWRLTKTRYGTVLSIRWKRSPLVVEASTSQPRSSQGLNSRQRRSRRRLEEFRKRKRSLDAPESADGRPDRQLQDPAPSKPPQLEDRSRPGHALAEKLPADFRPLDPTEQPSDPSKPNRHGSKETTRDQKDSNNDAMTVAMTRFDTCTGSKPISDGPTTRIGQMTSSATPPGSSLTQLGAQSRTCTRESFLDDDDVKSFSKEFSQAFREELRRFLSESVQQASDPTASPPRKKPPKPWR